MSTEITSQPTASKALPIDFDPRKSSNNTFVILYNDHLIASRIPPGLCSEVLRLRLEAPGLKARGCRVVLQEGDDALDEGEEEEGDEGQDQEN